MLWVLVQSYPDFNWRTDPDPFCSTPPKTEVNAFGSSQITMSEWLVPTLWSLILISFAVTSAVYVGTLSHWTLSLSRKGVTSILCRWLAGVNQRITPPLFLMVIVYHMFSILSHCYRTIIPQVVENVKCLFDLLCGFYSLFRLHTLLYHTISKCQEGNKRVLAGVLR